MYSTENKKIHYFYNGIFYTRSINEFVDDILFQKIYGGEGLLKKILKISKNSNMSFSSSMVNENSIKPWIKSGWTINHKLNVCVLNLRNSNHRYLSENKQIEIKKLEHKDIEYLLELDHKIFEDYWKNSKSGLGNNLLSCVINFAIEKKFINMKLNTQSDNIAALNLYKKNKFEISPRKLVIMKTS